MLAMGFPKKKVWLGVGGVCSIQFFWDFWNLFNFAKPLTGHCDTDLTVTLSDGHFRRLAELKQPVWKVARNDHDLRHAAIGVDGGATSGRCNLDRESLGQLWLRVVFRLQIRDEKGLTKPQ